MATSFAIAQKPERWDISRSKVARSGQRFWNGLTHCYPFWEGTGLKVYNVANPGVNIGTAADTVTTNWVRIKRLGGMVFFFNGDNLDVINAGTFDPPHAGTMLFGFDLTEDKTSERFIGGADAFEVKYGIVSGKIDNDFFAAGSTQLITNATFAQDTLYHIACTWNLAATSQQIYVDGLLDVESSTTGNDDPGDGLTLRFGSRTGTNNFVYGHMTHVCMYDWVLPAKLIWDLAVDPFAMLRRKKAAPTYFVPAAGADPVTVDNLFLNQAVQRAATI